MRALCGHLEGQQSRNARKPLKGRDLRALRNSDRRGRDSNPRNAYAFIRFPSVHNRPLCHLSRSLCSPPRSATSRPSYVIGSDETRQARAFRPWAGQAAAGQSAAEVRTRPIPESNVPTNASLFVFGGRVRVSAATVSGRAGMSRRAAMPGRAAAGPRPACSCSAASGRGGPR